jgi:hypothetical protein
MIGARREVDENSRTTSGRKQEEEGRYIYANTLHLLLLPALLLKSQTLN